MAKRILNQHQQQRILSRRSGEHGNNDAQEALVIMNSGRKAWVRIGNNSAISCHQRANLANVVAGDVVMVSINEQGEGVIESLLPRKSLLSRPGFRGVIKPISANIDQVLIVIAPTPGLDLSLLDRSLCFCAWQCLDACIILNKFELIPQKMLIEVQALASIYRDMGYTWIDTSTYHHEGITNLREQCNHKSSVFLGNSGVGKSSLTKALIPDIDIRTQALSEATGLGQHTTNNATLYDLPDGGQLIDAAGIRTLDLAEFSIEHPDKYWRDFSPYLGKCKFYNCTHDHEPSCAIRDAVEHKKIALHRYEHYLAVLHDH